MQSLFHAAERIREGASVVVFPEATITGREGARMLPFKKGGFLLAKKAKVPVQPFTISGSAAVAPEDRTRTLQRVHPGVVNVFIHPPIDPEEYGAMSVAAFSDRVRSVIEKPLLHEN